MAEEKTYQTHSLAGDLTEIKIGGRNRKVFVAVHHSGTGPGIILIADQEEIDAGIKACTNLFAEEGYSVLALGCHFSVEEIKEASQILKNFPQTEGNLASIGYGNGALLALKAASLTNFSAVVTFDLKISGNSEALLDTVPCPFFLQFGTQNQPEYAARVAKLKEQIHRKDGSSVFAFEEGGKGFSIPFRGTYNKITDDLAHSRSLELIRRVLGPYYDYEELFAKHVYHEFITRDVEATMQTMIGDPYVNHVPTLSGGVGYEMLKRFYKYHFVDQNSGGRDRIRVSYTIGPSRLVLENYTKFVHDSVIDRYFPGIAPTGKTVEIATVIIVKFRGDKVCHEHLYWDQGSALKQIGVLDASNLPIAGPEAARKVLDENQPSNIFMQEAWSQSKGKPV